MIGLPKPRLTATIAMPRARGALGDVTIEGETPPAKPRGGIIGRTNRTVKCSACDARGHTSRSSKCPARAYTLVPDDDGGNEP